MENSTDAFAQNRRLGRGVNIIGYDRALWQDGKGRMQDKHFRLIKQAGFNHVRINLHPFSLMGDAPDHAIDPAGLKTLDWAVAQALDNGLIAILDMHEFNAMAKDPIGLKAKFLAVWEQLAPRYKDYPDMVFFEILNEPHGELTVALWNELIIEPYEIIRSTGDQPLAHERTHRWSGEIQNLLGNTTPPGKETDTVLRLYQQRVS